MKKEAVIEARKGLKVKEYRIEGEAVSKLVTIISDLYKIVGSTPRDTKELGMTAMAVITQMTINYNLTLEEVRLAAEESIYNSDKAFKPTAANIIQALREYVKSDVYGEVRRAELRENEMATSATAEENRRALNRGVRERMEDIRKDRHEYRIDHNFDANGKDHPIKTEVPYRFAAFGALIYDYLMKEGKMTVSFAQYIDEGKRLSQSAPEPQFAFCKWSSDATDNAKEIALHFFLKDMVSKETK